MPTGRRFGFSWRRRWLSRSAALAATLWISGCYHYALLPPEDREALQRDLTTQYRQRFLRVSYYVTPFFGDPTKKLLTSLPPEEVRLLNDLGQRVSPGPAERVLPAGTAVRILKVEFPTAWAVLRRLPDTPRTQPWIHLETVTGPSALPLILVMPAQLASIDLFEAELDRYLSFSDPSPIYSRWSEPVREAVRNKNAIAEMPEEALEMAWGYPERKQISYQDFSRKEEWTYSGGARVAYLSDSRVSLVTRAKK